MHIIQNWALFYPTAGSDGWVTRLESDRYGGLTIDINKYMRRVRKSYTMYYIFVDIADRAEGMGFSGNP